MYRCPMVRPEPERVTEELPDKLMPPSSTGIDDDVEVPSEIEEWVDETKGVERIISVAITTSKPRTVDWISDQAVVAEQTARDHLETFAELGVVASFTASGVTKYHADEAFVHYREVSRLVKQHQKEELSDRIEEIQELITEIEESYDVESPDGLRALAAQSGVDTEDIRDYKKTASEWETLRDRLAVLEDAIRRFEKFDSTGVAKAK